jgi:hypothetical protein
MTDAGGQRPAAQSNQDGVERRHGIHQFQADGRRALAGLDVQAVFDQPDAVVPREVRGPLASHVEVAVHQLQPGVQCADAIKLGRRRKAGGHDGDVEPPAATGPSQGLAEVARAGAHHGPRAMAGQQARDDLGAASLEAADRIRRFELDAHRAPQARLQRLAAVQRGVEKNRIDNPASRPDPSSVQARLLHDTAA